MSENAVITEAELTPERDETAELPEATPETAEESSAADGVYVDGEEADAPDYALIVESDLNELRKRFPELREIKYITELENPLRYATLRDLGLTPGEAYLATTEKRRAADNRRHLSSAVPGGATGPMGSMSRIELERARDLFPGLGDAELHSLYKKVSV